MFNIFGTKYKPTTKKLQKGSVFGKKGYMSRRQLLWKLGSGSTKIPEANKWYNRQQLRKELRELFDSRRYGQNISEKEAKEVIRRLNASYHWAGWQDKVKITSKIKWLRKNLNIPKR